MKVQIRFGAMVPHIRSQLSEQGLNATGNLSDLWQRDAEAITRLLVRGVLSASAGDTARRKLLKNIVRNIRPPSTRGPKNG